MIGRKTINFRQATVIKQVGATPIRTKRGTVFKLGGGAFSKRQILASRRRLVRIKAPAAIKKKMSKADFGL